MESAKKVHHIDGFCPLFKAGTTDKIKSKNVKAVYFKSSGTNGFLRKGYMKRIILTIMTVAFFLISGCSNGVTTEQPSTIVTPNTEENYKIAFLCSDASNKRLANISEGIGSACEEKGMEYILVDCKNRDDLFLSFLNDIEESNVDALIVNATNEGLGPMVTSKCSELGIPVLCVESRLKTIEGKNAAYIGIGAYESGRAAAQEMADRAAAKGFFESGKTINLILMSKSDFFYEDQKVQGFRAVFDRLLPEFSQNNYVILEIYNSSFQSQYLDISKQLGSLEPDSLYIGFSFNDEGALALYRFANTNGFDMNNMLLGSIGGDEAAEEIFNSGGAESGNYICVGSDPFETGMRAADSIYGYLTDTAALQEMQVMDSTLITETNYRIYFDTIFGDNAGT